MDVSALAGGGRLNFEIDFNDGWTVPQRGRFEIKGFQLAPLFAQRLPALPPGRSKRDRIDGGVDVDAEFVLADLDGGLFDEAELLFQLDTNWSDGRIDASGVSPDPVTEINISTRFEGAWNMLSDRIDTQGHLVMGAVDMYAKASVDDVRTVPLIKVRVDGKKIPCKDAYRSLPTGILGPYAGLKIAGWFEPYIRFRLPLVSPKDVLLRFKGFVRSCEVQALNADKSVHPPVTGIGRRRLRLDDVTWLNEDFIFKVKEGLMRVKKFSLAQVWTPLFPSTSCPDTSGELRI